MSGKPRRIELAGRPIDYRLQHSRRRTLALRVDQAGLRVAVPLRTPQRIVDAFLADHRDWVIRTLDDWAARPQPQQIALRHGAEFPLLDQACRLEVSTGRGRAQWRVDGEGAPMLALQCISGQSVHRAAMAAIKARALTDFETRVKTQAARLGRVPPPVRLTSARTRWGSCSERAIRLHWRLIHLPADLIDYVVAHEVAHLVHMNHSPAFWAVVESIYPGAQGARRRLRACGPSLPELIEASPG
ncbi:M48 family metallopeptidase [Nitrogeniibacter mangrovi]|uniref:M48 family metallopeptidase n=1 Tax=Nitrogeniibacter mangrovi TaxID=2016596 RepID=UPI001E348C55|nr:SprT family zinc-dependent metalloprotease [Nitrogeniibacter mangrovi]